MATGTWYSPRRCGRRLPRRAGRPPLRSAPSRLRAHRGRPDSASARLRSKDSGGRLGVSAMRGRRRATRVRTGNRLPVRRAAMPALEIRPYSEDYREDAARLLAARYTRERAAEPLLPDVDDLAAHIPAGEGAVATRGGEVVAYLIASVRADRAEVGVAGVAATEPQAGGGLLPLPPRPRAPPPPGN